jgi:uncharacterized glyoxalase superfamily protein PhnB
VYKDSTPMLLVDDVDEALAWYQDELGAKLQYKLPDEPPFEWVSILLDKVEVMLAGKKAAKGWYTEAVKSADTPTNCIVYIYVESVDSLFEGIKEKVKVVIEPHDQYYGMREFVIQDPFGFILIFAESLE